MNTIISKLILAIDVTAIAPEGVSELWAAGMSAKAEIINQRRLTRIPDEETYLNTIADRAEIDYRPYATATFVSRKGLSAEDIIASHAANLKLSFHKYDAAWRYIFETVDGIPAKRFKEKVARSKSAYGRGIAARTLPMTGFKDEGRGPAAIAGFWLSGDQSVLRDLRRGDRSERGPCLITKLEDRSGLKAALTGRLIQAGVTILKSNLSNSVITAHNDRTNRLVQGFVDPLLGLATFTTGGPSHLDFTKENKQLFLEIQVSRV